MLVIFGGTSSLDFFIGSLLEIQTICGEKSRNISRFPMPHMAATRTVYSFFHGRIPRTRLYYIEGCLLLSVPVIRQFLLHVSRQLARKKQKPHLVS